MYLSFFTKHYLNETHNPLCPWQSGTDEGHFLLLSPPLLWILLNQVCTYAENQTKHTLSCLVTAKPNHKPSTVNSLATQWSCWVEPRGSTVTAVLIRLLVSNNVLVKCSSECSFLLPSRETSALLEAGRRSHHYRAEQEQQTEQKAIKTLIHVIFALHILKWCSTSINVRLQLFKETLNTVNKALYWFSQNTAFQKGELST